MNITFLKNRAIVKKLLFLYFIYQKKYTVDKIILVLINIIVIILALLLI